MMKATQMLSCKNHPDRYT